MESKDELLATPEPTVDPMDALRQEVEELKAKIAEKDEDYLKFRSAVVTAAARGKREHDWCNEIDDIIDNLGLDWGEGKGLRKMVEFKIGLSLKSDPIDPEATHSWWMDSLQVKKTTSPNGNGEAWIIYLDEDHHDVDAVDFVKDSDDIELMDVDDD